MFLIILLIIFLIVYILFADILNKLYGCNENVTMEKLRDKMKRTTYYAREKQMGKRKQVQEDKQPRKKINKTVEEKEATPQKMLITNEDKNNNAIDLHMAKIRNKTNNVTKEGKNRNLTERNYQKDQKKIMQDRETDDNNETDSNVSYDTYPLDKNSSIILDNSFALSDNGSTIINDKENESNSNSNY